LKRSPQTGTAELSIDEVVVSATVLADRLDGIGRLVVRRGSVITPAARDLLRERSIELSYRTETKTAAARNRLVVGVAETNYATTSLFNLLTREPLEIERVVATDLGAVVDELAEQLTKSMTLALLLTEQVACALCLANRIPGVRAAAASNSGEVTVAIQAIGANLLVIDPVGKSPFIVKQSIARFSKGGPRACPEVWQQRLA
jgi:hypothetical protein